MVKAWNAFWFAEGSPVALGLFRVLFGACLLAEIPTSRLKSVNALNDGLLHVPYFDLIRPVSEQTYQLLHGLQYPLIGLLMLGVSTRVACGGLLAVQGWLFLADQLNFRNHPYLFLLLLLLLMLSPAGESLSLAALIRAVRRRAGLVSGRLRPLTMQRLIQVQICIVYFFAGLHKLHAHYLEGHVLRSLLPGGQSDALLTGAAWATVVLELALPFGLWFKHTRAASMLVGIVFHATIAWTLDIRVFSYVMIASYLLFLDPEALARLVRRFGPVRGDA
jgi:hypothetical protein